MCACSIISLVIPHSSENTAAFATHASVHFHLTMLSLDPTSRRMPYLFWLMVFPDTTVLDVSTKENPASTFPYSLLSVEYM